jgi:hypothetical protein
MLFLMNDRVLKLADGWALELQAARFEAIGAAYPVQLGRELFAEQPMLHREAPERAGHLALLLLVKAPEINAALFMAPSARCRPDQVITRFASLPVEVMVTLLERDKAEGGLTPELADREVWSRLAA